MIKNCFAVLLFILSFTLFASQSDPSFQQVKKIARIIWADHRIDMYCHCKFDKQLQVDWKSCGYEPGDMLRAKRIEWEHIVPASWLGRHRACWANGQGRNMCEKSDKVFREMYTDLHNLIPVIGEINKERQAYRFAEFSTNKSTAHGCEFYIDRDYRTVEPNSDIKGLIARAHLYMADTYPFKLSKAQRALYIAWNKQYPPDSWEKEWNRRVGEIQGRDNRFISQY